MTEQEQREFEADLRSGLIGLPVGTTVLLSPRYPAPSSAVGNFLLLVCLPALGIALVQYLLAGFANPFQLFKMSEPAR